jgi:SAM-dependent methyltransferase
MTEDWRALNLANWNERTPHHLRSALYDFTTHRAGRGQLDSIVEAELGPVTGLRILHLQCHLGDDSLALAQRGAAEVIGIDFSRPAIEAARELSRDCGAANTRFIESDLYAAPNALPGHEGAFDLVFTSWGVIGWLPDIAGWARVVAHFLRPGGAFYFAEAHPAALVFDGTARDGEDPRPDWLVPYFERAPRSFDDPTDYADPETRLANSRTVQHLHPLSDILGALRDAGLSLDWLREHRGVPWQMFPFLVRGDDRLWTWPREAWLPLSLSLRAVKA